MCILYGSQGPKRTNYSQEDWYAIIVLLATLVDVRHRFTSGNFFLFGRYEEKIKYDIVGHSGEEEAIPFVTASKVKKVQFTRGGRGEGEWSRLKDLWERKV